MIRPKIVCLCGSTRFHNEYVEANFRETMAGNIVLSSGVFGHTIHKDKVITDADKTRLDELHKHKIDMADEILVINPGGYIGDSTANEIRYAQALNKHIRYWSDT